MPTASDEPLGEPKAVPPGGWRAKIRANPPAYQVYRVAVFVVGLLFVALGIVLAALPGPLTIPPVLLGLYVWSTEFAWAERIFVRFREKGLEAWTHAKAHPVSSAAITVGGLVLAGVAFWAVSHFELVDKTKDAIGV